MKGSPEQAILCPQCNQTIVWTEFFAGVKVRCTCGREVVMPNEPPKHSEEDDYGSYDLADEPLLEELPPRTARPPVQRQLNYESKTSYSGVTFGDLLHQLKDPNVLLAAGVIFGGIVFRFCMPFLLPSARTSMLAQAGIIVISLIVSVVTLLAGAMMVAKFTGADLGSPVLTVAKLCAVAVLDMVLFALVASIDRGDGLRGMIIAWHVLLLFNWVAFSTMFEFDMQEALFAVALVGFMQAVGTCVLWHH